jgi:hypothetical protein
MCKECTEKNSLPSYEIREVSKRRHSQGRCIPCRLCKVCIKKKDAKRA